MRTILDGIAWSRQYRQSTSRCLFSFGQLVPTRCHRREETGNFPRHKRERGIVPRVILLRVYETFFF